MGGSNMVVSASEKMDMEVQPSQHAPPSGETMSDEETEAPRVAVYGDMCLLPAGPLKIGSNMVVSIPLTSRVEETVETTPSRTELYATTARGGLCFTSSCNQAHFSSAH